MSENISVKEFKMWLRGVEEMQPEGWTPDSRQWAKIREKIEQITETQQAPSPVHQTYAQPSVPLPQASGPSEWQAPALPPTFQIPAAPSSLPPQRIGGSGAPIAVSDGMSVHTPNIDTSSGKYTSSFA